MKNQSLIQFILFGLVMLFTSCADEQLSPENDLDQLIEETPVFHNKRSCGKDHHMEKLMSDPIYKTAYDKRMNRHLRYTSTHVESRSACTSPATIPVAVHFQGATGALACLVSAAEQAVGVLNADYQGNNGDLTNWTNGASSSFPGVSNGSACLQFTLANKNHPSGFGLTDGDLAVTKNATSGDFDNRWSGYLNIYVNDADGNLGYSPLGGAGNGDGVVINRTYFGVSSNCGNVNTTAPYNLGRTLTHEVGHYLLLDHIWGNGCGQDDGIADTPNQDSDYSGCPSVGASSCGSVDMHMNYMDYVDDACMYMFSDGQVTVSENYVASNLTSLTSNAPNVISGSTGGGGNNGNQTTCATPATASAQVQSNTSATISWEAQSGATEYQLAYRQSGTTSWTSVTTTAAQRTITGLTAGTTYNYRVRALCPNGWTGYTTIQSFTTTGSSNGGCAKPSYSQVTYVNSSRSKVTWEAMPNAIRYQVRYRLAGNSTWITRSSSTAQRTLAGLQPGSTYEYKIRTRCPSGWTSFTAVETFVHGNNGGNGGGNNNSQITFKLTLDDYGSETSWELLNDNFQVIDSGGPYQNGNSGQVITKNFALADGCYTLYVDDSYGDGICCFYGDGSFELTANGNRIGYSNGQFGYYDYIDFCI